MKRKIERLLLVFALLVFICPSFQVHAAKIANSTDSTVQATFDERTITVSSSKDADFKLSITVTCDSTISSWESENLSINAGSSTTYNLEDLVPSYTSPEIKLTSVSIEDVVDKNAETSALYFIGIFVIILVVIVVSGIRCCCADYLG